jgi:hypothetical protein
VLELVLSMLAVRIVSHTYGRRGRSLGEEGIAPQEELVWERVGKRASRRVVFDFSTANCAPNAFRRRITLQQRRNVNRAVLECPGVPD